MKTALYGFLLMFALAGISSYGQHTSQKIDKRVVTLIKKMSDQKTEEQAFIELESLGCPAVPAIIERMDDRRKLPDPRISLRNNHQMHSRDCDITAQKRSSMRLRPF